MVESLVITLREGIEAALVIGIILAYLGKTGRIALSRYVYTGLALAVVASVGLAVLYQAIGFDPENEVLEGTMLGIAGVFVATMVVWMWRTARNIKGEMESRLASIVNNGSKSNRGLGLGLATFTFFMVLREGVETVLFLAAATLGKFDILSILGAIIGIGLAALFAIFFIRGSLRINLARFFNVTGVVLLLLAIKLFAGSLHEFAEVGMIPMNKEMMNVLGYFVRDASSTIILMALLAVPLFFVLWDTGNKPVSSETLQGLNPAERRRLLASNRSDLMWRLGLTLGTLLIILAMASTVFAGGKVVDPTPVPVAPSGSEIRIPVAELPERTLAKFVYQSAGGTNIRFIVARLSDEDPMVALDACDICGSIGYLQEEGNAICKNCNAPIAMETIGLGGGCNPIALGSSMDDSDLVIKVSELTKAEKVFVKK